MALIKAARNFDPSHGVEFLSYAVVTMKGEVKRQFRDFGWMVRPPRPIQKLQADVAKAQSELTQQLGRSPRVPEVSAYLGVSEDEVLEALSADGCFAPTSLDLPLGEDGSTVLGETLLHDDSALDEAEARVMLMPAVRTLPERERREWPGWITRTCRAWLPRQPPLDPVALPRRPWWNSARAPWTTSSGRYARGMPPRW